MNEGLKITILINMSIVLKIIAMAISMTIFDVWSVIFRSQLTASEFLRELDRSASGLLAHQAQFLDVKAKIEKRKRKLVDYDSSRHAIQQLRQNKKKDDPKLIKAEEKNSDARRMYESLNQVRRGGKFLPLYCIV